MPEPIEFRIVQSLQAALKGIRIASGYHHDVAGLAVKLDPDHKAEELIPGADPPFGPPRPFLVLVLGPDEFIHEPASQIRLRMPFVVLAAHDSDVEDDDSKLGTYHRLCADIEKAVATDITRGGLACDTRLLNRVMRERESGGREVWAQVTGEVRVYRSYGAPNG